MVEFFARTIQVSCELSARIISHLDSSYRLIESAFQFKLSRYFRRSCHFWTFGGGSWSKREGNESFPALSFSLSLSLFLFLVNSGHRSIGTFSLDDLVRDLVARARKASWSERIPNNSRKTDRTAALALQY